MKLACPEDGETLAMGGAYILESALDCFLALPTLMFEPKGTTLLPLVHVQTVSPSRHFRMLIRFVAPVHQQHGPVF